MQQDSSWQALSKPGEATEYFDLQTNKPLQCGVSAFNISNASWLAEISRLTYQPDFHLNKKNNLGRFEYKEIGFVNKAETSTHVSLLKVKGINSDGYPQPCLVVAFRGTDDLVDWNNNIKAMQTPFNECGLVHAGFNIAYESIKEELFFYLEDLSLPIFVTGHSLGAALATLLMAEIMDRPNFDSCYTFGSPRVGDAAFANALNNKSFYRIINNCDIITTVPISIPTISYQHCGTTQLLNNMGMLIEGLSEEDILSYQKNKMLNLKDYALQELFSKNIMNIKGNLPPVLADHAPINYVLALENQAKTD
ncbi:MAG: triacylglycerol lipase [Gammaproteobacteria bacterium]|jgi:triacylglycerol lipase